jgi:hypothetical protein
MDKFTREFTVQKGQTTCQDHVIHEDGYITDVSVVVPVFRNPVGVSIIFFDKEDNIELFRYDGITRSCMLPTMKVVRGEALPFSKDFGILNVELSGDPGNDGIIKVNVFMKAEKR